MNICKLYCDGGVVHINPSPIGGTYAYRILHWDETVIKEASHFISCKDAKVELITNNMTEMMALVKGLEQLPEYWVGQICSDSAITLGRAFSGWKWKNIPEWLKGRFEAQRKRLVHWEGFSYLLLDGHPTKLQLASGFGKRGSPVSIHNVWCDEACGRAALSAKEMI